ncbi:hypothetical protein R1sor_017980 [Riccia sorocarpa]|uniref:Methyltransferase n=1 Tax=Riccia sorocarpa TaxID=122646 RepID=A0ABD3I8D8_9MARC
MFGCDASGSRGGNVLSDLASMGYDNLSSISPAKWRPANPQSPSCSPYRKSGIPIRDGPLDKPDLEWKTLLKRHRFLLFMLAILAFLCTIYLYFAVTFSSVDTCKGLEGTSRSQCYNLQKGTGQSHSHQRRRALNVVEEDPLNDCSQHLQDYSPCRDASAFEGPCRRRHERPPLCLIPTPVGYQRPRAWHKSTEATSKLPEFAGLSFAPLRKIPAILSVGCPSFESTSSAYVQKEDASTLTVLGLAASGACIRSTLYNGSPALLVTLLDASRLPAHSFDLIRSDECGGDWRLGAGEYISELSRLVRPDGYYMGRFIGNGVEEWTDGLKKLNWTLVDRSRDYFVWRKKDESGGVNGLVGVLSSRTSYPSESSFKGIKVTQYNQELLGAGATHIPRTLSKPILVDADIGVWRRRVAHYGELLGKRVFGQVRNVLDMTVGRGSFAAALMDYHPVWVLSVVPKSGENYLEDLYSRGLLGLQHDWSEALPTPPRSYDLVHSSWTFSHSGRALEIVDMVLEVDRVLRPGGVAIFRDTADAAGKLKLLSGYVRWRVLHEYQGETEHTDYVLIVQKEMSTQ